MELSEYALAVTAGVEKVWKRPILSPWVFELVARLVNVPPLS